ncbi:MAG: hypothetical protein R6W85_12990 [Gillisia sp.]
MTAKELTYLFENSTSISSEDTSRLERVLQEHPYFQAAHAIHLKGLYTQNSLKYNSALKKTAAYTIDRSVLFEFITSRDFIQDKVAIQIKKQEENLRNITVFEPQEVFGSRRILIDDAIKMKKNESERVMDPGLFEKPSIHPLEEEIPEKSSSEEIPEAGSPLDFNASETHSFSEWLSLTKAKPIERENENTSSISDSKTRNFELIDHFISKSPKIKPNSPSTSNNLAADRGVPPEALMTETLARVYLEQKNYKKAMQAYKILILKNPEKSGFFADQIRAIKKLQENNTVQE